MKPRAIVRATALLLMGTILAGDKPVEVEDTLAMRALSDIQWAPDGTQLFLTLREWQKKDNRYASHIFRVPLEGEPVQMTRGEKGESEPRPSPDGRYLAFLASRESAKSEEENPGAQIWVLPLGGGEAFQLTQAKNGVQDYDWSPDSQFIAFSSLDPHPDEEERKKKKKEKLDAVVVDSDFQWTHLWKIGIDDKTAVRLTEGEFDASGPRWSPYGERIAFLADYSPSQPSPWKHIDDRRGIDIYLISAQGGETENLTPGEGQASSPRWSPDGAWLSFSASGSEDITGKTDLAVLQVEPRIVRVLSPDDPYPIESGGVWTPDGQALYYTQGRGLYTHLFRISPRGGEPEAVIEALGIGGGFDVSPQGRLAYAANDPLRPADLWVGGADSQDARQLTDFNPQAREFALGESRAIDWKSPDGMRIEGVLTLPVGYRQGEAFPLILHIHGGPTGRHRHDFDTRAQFWAGKGYAVLQPNPRGSTGYGHRFALANQSDWGGKDFHFDDMSGVDYLVESGIADPEKLLVMGGSYGGFSTFWAITQTDRFKAAVAHAAISDWYSFYGQTDIPQYLKWGFDGHAWESVETYRRFSPIEFVRNVKTPLLITHGERDRRVHIAQAEQYYTALKKLGVEVVFVRYPREGHGIREPNHVIDWLNRQLEWFDRHLGVERKSSEEVETTGAR